MTSNDPEGGYHEKCFNGDCTRPVKCSFYGEDICCMDKASCEMISDIHPFICLKCQEVHSA
ncbi:MAG: hypothetical protein U9O20_00765 [Patescibacteria group bacterium]|nr:hypothetical protein [Patescibacteria group bacterium]